MHFNSRPVNTEIDGDTLIIQPLGAGREVGRSCIYMSYQGKVVLFDCGVLPEYRPFSYLTC